MDAYFSNVGLLLHGEGSSIVDDSSTPKTISVVGTAGLSTTQKRFGDSSIYIDNTGMVSAVGGVDVTGATAFTVEAWVYPTLIGGAQYKRYVAINANNSLILIRENRANYLEAIAGNAAGTLYFASTTTAPTLNTWQHLALSVSNNTARFFKNGVLLASRTVAGVFDLNNHLTGSIQLGNSGTEWCRSYLDEVRVTYNIDRYFDGFPMEPTPFSGALVPVTNEKIVRPIVGKSAFQWSALAKHGRLEPSKLCARNDFAMPYFGGSGAITGVSEIGSTPVKARIRLYEANSGQFIREMWSGADGTYTFPGLRTGIEYTVTAVDPSRNYNDVIAARVTAV